MTLRRPRLALVFTCVLSLAASSYAAAESATPAAAPADAKQLYEQHCVRCHTSEVYTRPDHRITSLDQLKGQVRRCEQMLNLTWFDEDIDAVTAYLNERFYRFKP